MQTPYHIVLVEDNRSHAEFITSGLPTGKYQVRTFYDGKSAYRYLRKPTQTPDAIIVDHFLPDTQGTRLIKELTQQGYLYGFIILTSHGSVDLAVKAMQAGALNFLPKTINIKDEIKLIIDNTIAQNRGRIERRALEEKIRESETIFKMQYKNIPVPTYTWRRIEDDFELTDYNQAAWEITEGTIENNVHSTAKQLFEDVPEIIEKLEECYWTRSNVHHVHFYKFKTLNKMLCFNTTYVYLRDDLIMVHTEDITERKRAEERQKQHEAKLKELNATKDRLFSIIGHDLRSPIGSLKQLLDILVSGFDLSDTSELKKILGMLKDKTNATYDLLENLLYWAKSQQNELEVHKQNTDLGKLVKTVIDLYAMPLQEKGIQLSYQPEGLPEVYADENMLTLVLRNLIGNAIKFTPKGKKIDLNAIKEKNEVKISITDEGVGIPPEKMNGLFHLTESTYGTNKEKGSGLGLMLCKDFMEKQNGHIDVESTVGQGTTFTISLPQN